MIRTAGRWDPSDRPIVFLVDDGHEYGLAQHFDHQYLLVPLNVILSPDMVHKISRPLERGINVLMDSGTYDFALKYAHTQGISLPQAFGATPEEMPDFPRLFDRYVDLAREWGDQTWGYIEIDLGGRENKLRLRARLEKLGLRPIPVWHPMNDGVDYFDFLAERYDRVCVGNFVSASESLRARLLHLIWDRHRRYPDLWIHVLGMSTDISLLAYPCDSIDTSTWMSGVRWGYQTESASLARIGKLDGEFRYDFGVPVENMIKGNAKALLMAGRIGNWEWRTWRHVLEQVQEITQLPTYPEP